MKWSSAAAAIALVASGAGLMGCNDGTDRSEGRYCTEVGNHLTALNTPPLGAQADIDAMLGEWRTVARAAPLSIEPEWEALVGNLETAATVDPSDAASVQKVVDSARHNEPAANRVIDYTQRVCGVTIGDVKPVVTTTTPATTAGAASTTTNG